MVIVRESPHQQRSPGQSGTQWPPKSPFQALLSSPSGRKRWEDRQNHMDRRTPSPSPIRHASHSSRTLQPSFDSSDEEDEETLKLQLQQIQTKLKLKELQKSRGRGSEEPAAETGSQSREVEGWQGSTLRTASPGRSAAFAPRKAIEVPVSPTRENRAFKEPISPARAKLGLTSVTRAEDISLKRARDGTQISRSKSLRAALRTSADGAGSRPKSFSERLADSKTTADERQSKIERLNRIRSTGFGRLAQHTLDAGESVSRSARPNLEGLTGRLTAGNGSSRSKISTLESTSSRLVNPSAKSDSSRLPRNPRPGNGAESRRPKSPVTDENGDDNPGYEPFSEIHLSRRHISHAVVAREMAGKEIYPLPRLLKEVKSPDYDPPDCESDYVVFAVLASKSDPFDHVKSHRTTDKHQKDDLDAPRNKFMVLHLCDLKWEIDCFLFGSAFTQFWKLTPGTLLAILNPAILPPKGSQDSGQFSLKLGSSEDCVMEIGLARDLGYCSSIKKDGQGCGAWIDKSKTEACDFHISLLVDKQRKHRMEVNTMWRGLGNSEPKNNSRAAWANKGSTRRKGVTYHPEYGQLYSVNTGMHQSAATLLDADDKITQAEASRRRIAEAQKERDLAKQLATMGNSIGAEYLRASNPSATSTSAGAQDAAAGARNTLFNKPSAAELGLLSNKASDTHLSPAKDRRRHFGLGALSMTTGGTSALGWGGARRAGLLQPKENRLGSPEKGQTQLQTEALRTKLSRPRSEQGSVRSTDSTSPQKKRARFALAKGIREPGRESLPGEGLGMAATVAGQDGDGDDEDDDGLDIV